MISDKQVKDKRYNKSLINVRLIAILLVLLTHIFNEHLYTGAVIFFFVITGYVMAAKLEKSQEINFKFYIEFLIVRYIKIFPIIIIFSSIFIVMYVFFSPDFYINPTLRTLLTLFVGLDNIYFIIRDIDYYNIDIDNIFVHLWAFAVIFQYYIIIPIFYLIIKKLNLKTEIFFLLTFIISFLYSFIFKIIFVDLEDGFYFNISHYFLLNRLWQFLIGVIIFYYFEKFRLNSYLCIVSSIFLFFMWQSGIFDYYYQSIIISFLVLIIFIVNFQYQIKVNKFFYYIGESSFMIYLVSLPLLYFLNIFFFANIKILIFLTIIFIGILINKLIYKNLTNFIMSVYKKRSLIFIYITSFFYIFVFLTIFNKNYLYGLEKFLINSYEENNIFINNFNNEITFSDQIVINGKSLRDRDCDKNHSEETYYIKNCYFKKNGDYIFNLIGTSQIITYFDTFYNFEKIDIIKTNRSLLSSNTSENEFYDVFNPNNPTFEYERIIKNSNKIVNYKIYDSYEKVIFIIQSNMAKNTNFNRFGNLKYDYDDIENLLQLEKLFDNDKFIFIYLAETPNLQLNYKCELLRSDTNCSKKISNLNNKLVKSFNKYLKKYASTRSNIYFFDFQKYFPLTDFLNEDDTGNEFFMFADNSHISKEFAVELHKYFKKFLIENNIID